MAQTTIHIPDLGAANDVDVIEVLVSLGDKVDVDTPLITLESEKASMDVPSTIAGVVKKIDVTVGDKVSQGDAILMLETDEATQEKGAKKEEAEPVKTTAEKPPVAKKQAEQKAMTGAPRKQASEFIYAGPGVRRFGRELGVDLSRVQGTGRKERITKEDVKAFVKYAMQQGTAAPGLTIAPAPDIDFSQFGPVESKPLNKIKRLTATNLHRNWVTIPHVTQFDHADITELEAYRKQQKPVAAKQDINLTPLAFIMKAVVFSLQEHPQFNASLDTHGENLIFKQYYHLGVAVDTPNGLVVPVIRECDKKSVFDIAAELGTISAKAREKGLTPAEMSGSCFTISSLGGIGGTAFTPIINAPDVAILGVSKASMQPVYQDKDFVARFMLPLSLSYDHRVIDGAEAARFCRHLTEVLSDVERFK